MYGGEVIAKSIFAKLSLSFNDTALEELIIVELDLIIDEKIIALLTYKSSWEMKSAFTSTGSFTRVWDTYVLCDS